MKSGKKQLGAIESMTGTFKPHVEWCNPVVMMAEHGAVAISERCRSGRYFRRFGILVAKVGLAHVFN